MRHWFPVAAVLVLGAFGTGVAMIVYNGLIRDIGATGTSLVTFIPPVVAVALGAAALGEPVTWNLFAGAAVVIVGVALAEGRIGAGRSRAGARPTDGASAEAPITEACVAPAAAVDGGREPGASTAGQAAPL